MKQLLFCVAGLAALSVCAQQEPSLQSQFPLKWKVKTGGATFKTNFLLHEGLLIAGSNGAHYRDWRLDHNNGVYIISPVNGNVLHRLAGEGFGDMDVNGVAAHKNRIYFGNDNEEFFCYDTGGRQLWRVPVSGDVESEPVLLDANCDGVHEVIAATEAGEVTALDARNGNTIWSFKITDFEGWSKTDNRFLFKVGAYFSNGRGFIAKPAIADLNGDAIPDLVYTARDNYTYALNGANGKMLWKFQHGELYFIANTPVIVKDNIYLLQYTTDQKTGSKQQIVCLNSAGTLKQRFPASWNYSVSQTPLHHNGKLISVERDTLVALDLKAGTLQKKYLESSGTYYGKYYYTNALPVTARLLVFDFLKTGNAQILLIHQDGLVRLLDANTFKQLKKFRMPQGAEATPLIEDIDGDGNLEMLVNCYDGYLYCYDLKTSSKGFIAAFDNPTQNFCR